MIEISDEYMAALIDGKTVATARWSWHAAEDGNGAWTVSAHPARLAAGLGDNDPFVRSWPRELFP